MRQVAAADGGNLIWNEKRIEVVRIQRNNVDGGTRIQMMRIAGVCVWLKEADGGYWTYKIPGWY
jgi:hypothetical protein